MIPGKPPYEFHCPIHGFITLDEWEREIISQAPFQRLRRIRQLAWTDQVYPGAMHTRFEHSLGVMHTVARLFDSITQTSMPVLESSELRFDPHSLQRQRRLIRLAALLRDVGHSPFSHGSEDVFPVSTESGEKYEHEDYSAAIVREKFRAVIDDHPTGQAYPPRCPHRQGEPHLRRNVRRYSARLQRTCGERRRPGALRPQRHRKPRSPLAAPAACPEERQRQPEPSRIGHPLRFQRQLLCRLRSQRGWPPLAGRLLPQCLDRKFADGLLRRGEGIPVPDQGARAAVLRPIQLVRASGGATRGRRHLAS